MALTMPQMWAVARGEQSLESAQLYNECADRIMTLDEAAALFALDEAYFGKKPVTKLQSAMDTIYNKVVSNPNATVQGTTEARALEKAMCDVFGFASCSIYWASRPGMGFGQKGPCTLPRCKILHANNIPFKYGQNQSGFYDKNHELNVFINTDQTLFTDAGLTSAEMLAIILHEVGHNFDYSMWTIIGQWWNTIARIIDVLTSPPQRQAQKGVQLAVNMLTVELGGGVWQALSNIDDILINAIPPIGSIIKSVQRIGFNVMKLLNAVLSPVTMAAMIPMTVAMTPFKYLVNTPMRKGEVYSDSFAASYGYSAELVTGLEKINVLMYQDGPGDIFLAPFYDLMMLQADVLNTCTGGHGSTQQRALRMVDKLDKDLEASGLSNADKAIIRAEKERLLATYDKFIKCDGNAQSMMTRAFRQMINNWYGGKNYMFVPIMQRDLQYAE